MNGTLVTISNNYAGCDQGEMVARFILGGERPENLMWLVDSNKLGVLYDGPTAVPEGIEFPIKVEVYQTGGTVKASKKDVEIKASGKRII